MKNDSSLERQKVLFRLERGDDGYPPVAVEGLWALRQPDGSHVVDNIPFFALGIAPGDTVLTLTRGKEVWFDRLHAAGGASVFRIRANDAGGLEKIREDLLGLGLPSEINRQLLLVAVEVPAASDIRPLLDYLVSNQEVARLDFEEAALRHSIPD